MRVEYAMLFLAVKDGDNVYIMSLLCARMICQDNFATILAYYIAQCSSSLRPISFDRGLERHIELVLEECQCCANMDRVDAFHYGCGAIVAAQVVAR